MTKPNGHANGAGHNNNDDDGKIHSLDDARRRAAQKAKGERRVGELRRRPLSAREWIIGGVMIAMAVAGLASFFIDMTGHVGGSTQ